MLTEWYGKAAQDQQQQRRSRHPRSKSIRPSPAQPREPGERQKTEQWEKRWSHLENGSPRQEELVPEEPARRRPQVMARRQEPRNYGPVNYRDLERKERIPS